MKLINGLKTENPKREEDKYVIELGNKLVEGLKAKYKKLDVFVHKGLFHSIMIDDQGNYYPQPESKPTWKNSAFKSDVIIGWSRKGNVSIVPLVRIEVKLKTRSSFNTDNIMLYSNKSKLHKHVYPYMRFGFLFYKWETIPECFYMHADNIDFGYAIEENANYNKFIKLLVRQIESAQNLIKLYNTEEAQKTTLYESNVNYG